MAVNPIPDEYPQVITYLIVDDAEAAIAFYRDVFGATERLRMPGPDGKIGHAELEIGRGLFMLADAAPEDDTPTRLGGTPVTVMVYVEDVDQVFDRALQAGGKEVRAVADQFYGDRSGIFLDPFGHKWYVATHVEDIDEEEMGRRAAEFAQQG